MNRIIKIALKVLFAVIIMTVSAVIVMSYYQKVQKGKTLEAEVKELVAAIRQSQHNAITNKQEHNPKTKEYGKESMCWFGVRLKSNGDKALIFEEFYGTKEYKCSEKEKHEVPGKEIKLSKGELDPKYLADSREGFYVKYLVPLGNFYSSGFENSGYENKQNDVKIKIDSKDDPATSYTICVFATGRIAYEEGDKVCK